MSDLKNSPYKNAAGVISHPGAPRGGAGSGGSSAVGSPLADRTMTNGLIPPEAPAASTWSPQQIADPSLYQRAKCIYQVLDQTEELWPAAVFEETGYQLKGVLQSLIPGLLQMLAVVGLGTVGGAAAGGFIGAFFGGVGAVPGAVVGAQLGAELSTAILTWLGLGFLIVAIGDGLGELAFMVSNAFSIAWHAAENPQEKKYRVNQAARELARAIAVLVRLILQGILAYVLKNAGMATARAGVSTVRSATTAGVKATAETSVAEVAGLIRKSKLPDEFALWLEKNWDDLARNPKLMRKTVSQATKNESGPTTTPSQLKAERERLAAGDKPQEASGNATRVNETTNNKASKEKLKPGTSEHKADRWQKYKNRGGTKDYDTWSKQYDTNMRNYQHGLAREAKYREAMGATDGTLKTPLTNRQVDILKADELYAGQLKTGPVSLTKENVLAIQKDAELVKRGWNVEHILEQGASKPYLNALDKAGINYNIGPMIPQ